MREYNTVRKIMRSKIAERKRLIAEEKVPSPVHVKRHLELTLAISGLTEEIEELRSHKSRLLARAKCTDDKDMKGFSAKLALAKKER